MKRLIAWWKADKPWACKFGIHQTFWDCVGENVGTERTPIYITHTYRSCNYCPWRGRA